MFAQRKLAAVDRCSLLKCTNEFLIGAVRRTAPITMLIYGGGLAGVEFYVPLRIGLPVLTLIDRSGEER